MSWKTLCVLAVCMSAAADASAARRAKSPVRGAKAVVIRLGTKHIRGVVLPHQERGWMLAVDVPPRAGEVCAVELLDVTPEVEHPRRTLIVLTSQAKQTLTLGDDFVAWHAYQLTARCDARTVGSDVVVLQPPPVDDSRVLARDEDERSWE